MSHLWSLTSRIHPLHHWPADCYVKRDDELSCGISGSKLRKYASLIPYFKEQGIQRLIVIAGAQSNNLLAVAQLAREMQLELTAILLRPRDENLKGNFLLSRQFLDDKDIVWLERSQWKEALSIAHHLAAQSNDRCFVLPEGASVLEAIPGAMTLADDIIINEQQHGLSFQHIFVDSGSGLTAQALCQRLSQRQHAATVHVLLLADDESWFREKMRQWFGTVPENFQCFYPGTAKSFGAVNQTIRQFMKQTAREEGLLLDPVYSAKLFYSARHRIESLTLSGDKLLIHSGGLLSLTGFEWGG